MPKEPWKRVYESNQKKYNMQLATGVVLLGGTILVAVNTIRPNATPDFLHSTGFVTKLPEVAVQEDEAGGDEGETIVAVPDEEDRAEEAEAVRPTEEAAVSKASEEAAAKKDSRRSGSSKGSERSSSKSSRRSS